MYCFHCGDTDTHVTDGNGLCYPCAFDHPEGSDAPLFFCHRCGKAVCVGSCMDCQVEVEAIECSCPCEHKNAQIYLHEKSIMEYTLEDGEITDADDKCEAEPLREVEFRCSDCATVITYPDWTKAPEPLRTYIHGCFHFYDNV